MSRKCDITGKGIMTGNNVSHANNKTRRTFVPNVQDVNFKSDVLGKISMRVSANGLRTVEKNGGIDSFLASTPARKLTEKALSFKRKLEKAKPASA